MGVKRLLTIITALLVGAMLYSGLYQPDAPLMWLAATTANYAYMRAALLIVLLTLLIINPPRSGYFRMFLVAFSVALGVSTVLLSHWYAVGLMDAIIFMELSIIFMIEALESDVEKVKKVSFGYKLVNKK